MQTLPSSQLTDVVPHAPVAASQNPATHLSATAQSGGGLAQCPSVQLSTVQASPSSQSALVAQHPAIGVP